MHSVCGRLLRPKYCRLMIDKILETVTAALLLLALFSLTLCLAMHAFNLWAFVRAIVENS